jgi:hypothetical protein
MEMRAPARLDISSCSASGITWSNVPMSDQDRDRLPRRRPGGLVELGGGRGSLDGGKDGGVLRPDPVGKTLGEARIGRVRLPAKV